MKDSIPNTIISKIPFFKKKDQLAINQDQRMSNDSHLMNDSEPLNFLQEHIPTVNVDILHQRLNYTNPCNYPATSRQKSFLDWKMQIDDAPIFRYLFRNVKPGRHLEFGTWEGFGTCLCLEETDATVWTLNLPFGERDLTNESRVCYSFNDIPEDLAAIDSWSEKVGITKDFVQKYRRTDCIGFIGRLYLEKSLGNRVCQIYCDSREWDISKYPCGFFDSVLIDGGHFKDIVLNDTQKAMKLVKPGGMIMWHDFCINQEIYRNFKASQGVMDCIFENWDYISSNLRDIFWIEPSFILVGIRK